MSPERSWDQSSTSIIGVKEIFLSLRSVPTARRLAGPPNVSLVRLNYFISSCNAN
jgi:hypothetical protein